MTRHLVAGESLFPVIAGLGLDRGSSWISSWECVNFDYVESGVTGTGRA
jgi:hypothetical protein